MGRAEATQLGGTELEPKSKPSGDKGAEGHLGERAWGSCLLGAWAVQE